MSEYSNSPPETTKGPCCAPGDPAAVITERNRFFTGKYLTARDFHDEQSYFLARHRLHQRALHGWGIVCGLEVKCHPDPHCAQRGWVVVTPGIAIDCHGREVVLHEPTPVKLPGLAHDDEVGEEANCPPQSGCAFLLGIRYSEAWIEPVPILYDEENCGARTTHNRICERPCFRHREPSDGCWGPAEPPWCTHLPLPATDASRADCLSAGDDFSKPLCPCGDHGFVPLGRFVFEKDDKIPDKVKLTLTDYSGRRYLFGPLHPYTLTHICRVNWDHGGVTPLSELIVSDEEHGSKATDAKKGAGKGDHDKMRLTITFDRPLCSGLPEREDPDSKSPKQSGEPLPLYHRILRVRYEDVNGERKPIPRRGVAHLSACRRMLHYDIPMHCIPDWKAVMHDPIVYVTLDCDFLPDEQGRAVDGNHLRGALKDKDRGRTGDGIEGGVFESWFRLDWESDGRK